MKKDTKHRDSSFKETTTSPINVEATGTDEKINVTQSGWNVVKQH